MYPYVMPRNPEYKTIKVSEILKILYGEEEIKVKPFVVKAPIKKLSNGGARISISQEYDGYEALVFIKDKRGNK